MLRRLSVLGSVLLLCGVGVVCGGIGEDAAPAAAPGSVAARAAAIDDAELLRVASTSANPRLAAAAADPSTRALARTVELLREGLATLDAVPAYTATFEKREVVNGVLLDPQVMEMTLRHEPFGVHLSWVEGQRGRRLLYECDCHDGKMLVNPGGWRGRLTGTLRLEIDGTLACRESRHQVTSLGLAELTKKLLRYRLAELKAASDVVCELSGGHEFAGRPAWKNVLTYRSPEAGGEFRRSVVLIDREWSLPVSVHAFGWPSEELAPEELDARTLIERYAYTDVDFEAFGDAADAADLAAATAFRVK